MPALITLIFILIGAVGGFFIIELLEPAYPMLSYIGTGLGAIGGFVCGLLRASM